MIKKFNIYIMIAIMCIVFIGCENDEQNANNNTLNYTYNFNGSAEGFIINKTDVPLDYTDEEYEFLYELEEVPLSGETTKALSIEYNNMNKDMFVYVFKEIGEGNSVEANASYNATLSFDIGTNITDKAVGDKTFVKAGVSSRLPLPVEKSEQYDFNLDKGNNEAEGTDLKTLEGITKPSITSKDYEYKNYITTNQVTASKNGMIYAIVGLDSTYDGKIKFYVDNVNLKLEKVKTDTSAEQPHKTNN